MNIRSGFTLEQMAREAADAIYRKQKECGFVNTICYDAGVPAIVKQLEILNNEIRDLHEQIRKLNSGEVNF